MYLALVILHGVIGALCLVVSRGERKSIALRYWGAGLILYATGVWVNILASFPTAARRPVGNSLVAAGAILAASAMIQHSTVRFRKKWIVLGFLLTAVAVVVNHLRA